MRRCVVNRPSAYFSRGFNCVLASPHARARAATLYIHPRSPNVVQHAPYLHVEATSTATTTDKLEYKNPFLRLQTICELVFLCLLCLAATAAAYALSRSLLAKEKAFVQQ